MAMTKCKECGRDVSSKAKSCPGCGAQVSGKTASKIESVVKWGIAGIFLLFVLALAWSSVNNSSGQRWADDLNQDVEELQRQREQDQQP